MKMLLVCENEKEREYVAGVFARMAEEVSSGKNAESNFFEGGVHVHDRDYSGICPTDAPIAYALGKDGYTVYNFKTGKKTEGVEGDLAGLANLPEEDFPTL